MNSNEDEVTINGTDAYLGLNGIQGLEERYKLRIPQERLENGPYGTLENFVRPTEITL